MGQKVLSTLWRRASCRVFTTFLVVNLILLTLFYIVSTLLVAENMTADFENTARAHARLVGISVEQQLGAEVIRVTIDSLILSGEVAYASYVGADNESIIEFSTLPETYVFQETPTYGQRGDGIYGVSIRIADSAKPKARLRLGYHETPVDAAIDKMYLWGLYASGLYIILLIPISLLVASRLTSPLRRLGAVARYITRGDIEHSPGVHFGITELDELGDDIEHMRVQLSKRSIEIAERDALYQAVLKNTADGILTLDERGYIESVNEAVLAIFGYLSGEVLGTPFSRFLTVTDADKCISPEGKPHIGADQAFTGVHKNGENLTILLSISRFCHSSTELYTVVVQDVSERVKLEEKLARLASYDPLTGLPNRRLFHERLGQALDQAESHEKLVGILFLDLDHFKSVNESLGHMFGDLLIQAVAKRLLEVVRNVDIVARLGGDEFTIILTDISHVDDATQVAEKILEQFVRPFQLGEHETFISASIGIVLYPFEDDDIESLIKNADAAMYQAKASGRNTYKFYSARIHAEAEERNILEAALRVALQNGELEVLYQPQVMVQYQQQADQFFGKIVGAEALLRWRHPEFGMIYPDLFIPIAEETGLIIPIGEWVLHTACLQQLAWKAAGLPSISISINLSARQLEDPEIVDQIFRVVDATGIDKGDVELELTERMILHNLEEVAERLQELKTMGFMISIDDFGTGHSSLSNIQLLPIDEVKIDKSFIHNVSRESQNAAIVEAIIDMAHKLGLRVVAEGVELEEQLTYLNERNCDLMQGYYFSRPVSAAEFEILLNAEVEAQNPLLIGKEN